MPPSTAISTQRPGPLERTANELWRVERLAAFRRDRRMTSRRLLHRGDALLEVVEESRLRGHRLLPTPVWAQVVRFVGEVDRDLRDQLGIDRRHDHIGEVLFGTQQCLMARSIEERRPMQARIIDLFPPRDGAAAARA